MKDCSDLYRSGVTWPGIGTNRTTRSDIIALNPPKGHFQLDVTGAGENNDLHDVYCEDGWAHILVRDPVIVATDSDKAKN